MEYREQLQKFINYFRRSEKEEGKEAIGVEIEHFIVEAESLEAVNYADLRGIESILEKLIAQGWQGKREKGVLIQLEKAEKVITLEPGAQLEISSSPQQKIEELEKIYDSFLVDLIPILNQNNQLLLATGSQVQSKLEEIEWVPKSRYRIMSRYLAQRGKYAHHMMKAAASLQIAIDYRSEEDFIKKFKVANALSPLASILFDNSIFLAGQRYDGYAARTLIWSNCDPERCGIIKEAFADDFGYQKYAEYILNRRPILLNDGEQFKATGQQLCRDIFAKEELSQANLEHVLTMFFPDVRAKNFIEIRMMDSLAPELAWSAVAFWRGLLYDQSNLERLYQLVSSWSYEEVEETRALIIKSGLEAKLRGQKILSLAQELVELSAQGLEKAELKYLAPIEELIMAGQNPRSVVKKKLEQSNDKKRALESSILNSKLVEGG